VRKLHTELCELSTVVTELRQMLAAERAKVLNLPPLSSVRRAEGRLSRANQKHLLSF
jgi:hypothetical protein